MRTFLLMGCSVVALAFTACGPVNLAGSCNATCDCPNLNAPFRCGGEWVCNANKRCEYVCPVEFCGPGTDAGCTSPRVCRDSRCTERTTCG
jgi:hypothetical protein